MRSDSFRLDVRGFDRRGPFLGLALNKFLEIFGRLALGRNQNGAELLQALPGRVKETARALGQEYYTLSAGSELGSVDTPAAFQASQGSPGGVYVKWLIQDEPSASHDAQAQMRPLIPL